LLVVAGAGAGKTTTLASRVAHLIVSGSEPQRILLLTFSRRAAQEMKRRVESMVNLAAQRPAPLQWAGTFHSVGARLLRIYARYLDLDPGFTILDRADAEDLMNRVRGELGFARTDVRFPKKATCLSIYSRTINSEMPLPVVLERWFPYCAGWGEDLRELFSAYVEAKQVQHLMDYDDLLLYWSKMLQVEALAADVSGRFDHILVDEYQDTNRLQSSVISLLRPDGRGVTVVGDDAQAIYAFRAATVRNILDFPAMFDPPARVMTLEQNYRSTQPILDASNGVIALAQERFSKSLWSNRASSQKPFLVSVTDGFEQARYVAENVLRNRELGIPLRGQSVLFRTALHSTLLELELGRRNIPFVKFGGLKFVDTAHLKDLLAILRWGTNCRDSVAGHRALSLIPGIGSKLASRIVGRVVTSRSLVDTLMSFNPIQPAAAFWPDFVVLMRRLCSSSQGWPGDLDAAQGWYDPLLDILHDNPEARRADLDQLGQIAGTFSSREQFLTDLTLDPPDTASDESGKSCLDDEYLTLSTIHSAKGLEWSAVFILSVVDGCIPSVLGVGSCDDLEEERRLLYVGMTRAKNDLHLILPNRLYSDGQPAHGDRSISALRTRFIPPALLHHFEQRHWPDTRKGRDDFGEQLARTNRVRSAVRDMWR
jgi:DNA helicase-2/ATP-dependent DNA helicase PcrA